MWFHIPFIAMVYGTSNGPNNDIGHCLGPCSMQVWCVQFGKGLKMPKFRSEHADFAVWADIRLLRIMWTLCSIA